MKTAADINSDIESFFLTDRNSFYMMDNLASVPWMELELNRRSDPNQETKSLCRFISMMWGHTPPGIDSDYESLWNLMDEESFVSIKSKDIDYGGIVSRCTKRISDQTPKYNLIIPVRNRKEHLECFMKVAKNYMTCRDGWCVTVIFQENNEEHFNTYANNPEYDQFNFIDMPHDEWFYENFGDSMNRSLCYNVVSKIVECEYQINHDVDLIFDGSFLDNIEEKTSVTNFRWLQPFRGSRVVMLPESPTEQIMRNVSNNIFQELQPVDSIPLNRTPISGGAPGGSVVVKHSDFISFGGYDPELVWGYAPEDVLFWTKLEYYFNDVCMSELQSGLRTHCFHSDGMFSHDTNVELYHLHHPPTKSDNRYRFFPLYVTQWLLNRANRDILDRWIGISHDKLK